MAVPARASMLRRPLIVVVAALALIALFVALRPAIGGPQERSFDLAIARDGMAPREIRVLEGDGVTLRISADRDVRFHLHGYDLKVDVRPGGPATLAFRADRTGRFEIEDETTEAELGVLIVEPR